MTKTTVKKTPEIKTVKDLKNKMTAEKAMAFLEEENKKKAEKGLSILQNAVNEIQAIGCDLRIKPSINANDQIVSEIQVIVIR